MFTTSPYHPHSSGKMVSNYYFLTQSLEDSEFSQFSGHLDLTTQKLLMLIVRSYFFFLPKVGVLDCSVNFSNDLARPIYNLGLETVFFKWF